MATLGKPPNAAYQLDGNWYDADGNFIQGVNGQGETDAQIKATPGPIQTGPDGKPYRMINGQKWFVPPLSGPTGDLGGGLVHGRVQWNPQTGAYDTPFDAGKILSMVAAGIITAGVADAAIASGGTASAAATGSTVGPSTGANIAATSAAGSTAPESIAAASGGGATTTAAAAGGAGSTLKSVLSGPVGGALVSGGLGALETLFAPRKNSFADGSATDPRNIMKDGLAKTNDLFGSLSSQLKAGVDLPSSRVGNPPSFSGPSLPMNFGVTGSDPAQRDPSLLHLGFNDPRQPQPAGDPTNPTSSALAAFRMLGVKV